VHFVVVLVAVDAPRRLVLLLVYGLTVGFGEIAVVLSSHATFFLVGTPLLMFESRSLVRLIGTLLSFPAVASILLLPGIDTGFHECCSESKMYIFLKSRGFQGDFGYAIGQKDLRAAENSPVGRRSVCGRWGVVFSGDDLKAGRGDGLLVKVLINVLVNENDGAGRAGGVVDLGSGVGSSCGADWSSGGDHDGGICAGRDIEIAGIGTEEDTCDQRGDGGEFLAGGNEIDVHGADTRGLVDEAESYLARGGGLALVDEDELLEAGDGAADQDGVLGRGSQRSL
jgi:hypothetical protein